MTTIISKVKSERIVRKNKVEFNYYEVKVGVKRGKVAKMLKNMIDTWMHEMRFEGVEVKNG